MSPFVNLSVTIITKNEEANLPRCLKSLPPGAEVIVVDSNSQDDTQNLARSLGCQVYDRPFSNFADQKNFALSKASRPWILSIDADEELSRDSLRSLAAALVKGDRTSYRLPRQLVFMGRKMRFGKTKDAPIRLFPRQGSKFSGDIHEEVTVKKAREAVLKGVCLYHYSYQDLSDYFNRFNRYTSAIASNHSKQDKQVSLLLHLSRPWLEFLNRYILRLGFLDGYPGYTYALVSSLYAYIKYAKLRELGDS